MTTIATNIADKLSIIKETAVKTAASFLQKLRHFKANNAEKYYKLI
jgi:hypothetical protein